MSKDDFIKILERTDPQDQDARDLAFEEFVRYIATGRVNNFHASAVARMYMQKFAIPKVSPK